MEEKVCSSCKTLRTKSDFGNSSRSKDGKRSQCKYCEAEYRKKVKDSNEEFTLKNAVPVGLIKHLRNLVEMYLKKMVIVIDVKNVLKIIIKTIRT